MHIDDDALLAVDAPRSISDGGVFGSQRRQRPDRVGAAILDERGGNHFQRLGYGLVRPLVDAFHALGFIGDDLRQRHFRCASSRHQRRFHAHVPDDAHRVLQVSLDLVEDIFGSAAEQNGARFGVLAFGDEGEVFVADCIGLDGID